MFFSVLITIFTFISMEGAAWLIHKYIMHGFMWRWHESHHVHHKNLLEKNDLFSVCFGLFAVILIVIGDLNPNFNFLFWMGVGVTLYGVCYFLFHDVIVHRRIKIKFKSKNAYLNKITKAHYIHHEVHKKEGARYFGFLFAKE